ncbi:hypothetical protein CRENBAI_026247 [Crenichthys baileyi]|uniref:Solute carrier family 13 member 1 n=1 Tax=Crenichthys baileyi TaxID=28760 RepID=A0AAV9RL49_9TELE
MQGTGPPNSATPPPPVALDKPGNWSTWQLRAYTNPWKQKHPAPSKEEIPPQSLQHIGQAPAHHSSQHPDGPGGFPLLPTLLIELSSSTTQQGQEPRTTSKPQSASLASIKSSNGSDLNRCVSQVSWIKAGTTKGKRRNENAEEREQRPVGLSQLYPHHPHTTAAASSSTGHQDKGSRMWLCVASHGSVLDDREAVLQQILKAKESGCAGKVNPNLQLDETDISAEKIKETLSDEKNPDVPHENFTCVEIQSQPQPDPAQPAACVPAATSRCKRDLMMCKAMCLGIAYSSNIGGISTLPGTSPNLIFSEYLNHFTFLWRCKGEQSEKEKAARKVIEEEYKLLGAMKPQEIFTSVVFVLMVFLWLTRSPGFIPGWSSLFPHHTGYITDATVALLLGLIFFIVPAYGLSRKYEAMISWEEFQASMPWKVALLVGGGFALAEGAKESGLSMWVAELLAPLGDLPVLATVTVACIIVTVTTEVTSNAATITIFLPILSPLAEAIHVNPLYVLIPTTLCTSFSFLLPVSNPPNAVVFAYGHLTIMDMVKAGLGVNVIGVLAVMLAVATWGVPLFSLDAYPDWAPVLPGHNSTMP